ncbi:hypothetical protein ACF0H5_014911 [Mactra antiquata]
MKLSAVKLILWIYLTNIEINIAARDRTACGPSNKCQCEGQGVMNCAGSNLNLATVCGFLSNMTYNTTVLNMASNNISFIQKRDLEGCGQLTSLDLSKNNMLTAQERSFTDMQNLTELNLHGNKLSLLYKTPDLDLGLSKSLRSLKISGNVNVSLPETLDYPRLNDLVHLEALYMDGLPNAIFPSSYLTLFKLETLVLSGKIGQCGIVNIFNETFENVPTLTFLDLSACCLRAIDAGGFMSLRYLETLDLSDNVRLGFHSMRNISYSLQFTNIKVLDYSKVYDTFGLTTEMKKRDICYLRNTSLVEINFSRNRLALFESNSFILLPDSLKIVRAEDNKFTFGLYLLQIGCSKITEFYGSFQNHPHKPLEYDEEPLFNDSYSPLPYHDDCPYMRLPYLRNTSELNKYCRFFEPGRAVKVRDTIPFFPKNLTKVEFRQSNLVYNISKILIWPFDNNIEYIDVSGNVYGGWFGPIGPFPQLKYLDLSRCYCSYISPDFFSFGKYALETLLIQHNSLGKVLSDEKSGPRIFNDLQYLKILNLSKNTIPSLPAGIFTNLNNLETLDLSFNNLETLDDVRVDNLTNLLHLYLNNNNIRSLHIKLLQRMQDNSKRLNKTYSVDMRENTITLDCKYKDFFNWLSEHNSNMIGFSEYTFVTQEGNNVSTKEFMLFVQNIDKNCASYTLTIVLCSIGLSVYLAVLIGGVIYRNRWYIVYILRSAKIRQFRYRQLNDLHEVQYRNDLFISYAKENRRFVFDKCLPELERKGFNVCFHDKDFLPGNNTADNIVEAIANSRNTMIVLSKEFLRREWCLFAFNMARMESMYDRGMSSCIVVVLFGEISAGDMPTEMLNWIRSNSFIEYTDDERYEPMFWEHLECALKDKVEVLYDRRRSL